MVGHTGHSCTILLFQVWKIDADISNKLSHLQATSELGLILFGSLTKQSHRDLNLLHFWTEIPLQNQSLHRVHCLLSLPYEVAAVLNHICMSDVTRDKVNERPKYLKAQPCDARVFYSASGMIFCFCSRKCRKIQTFGKVCERCECRQRTNHDIWQ